MSQLSALAEDKTPEAGWRTLYRIAGVAALLAGVLFRRNIAAEISVFTHSSPPGAVEDWFRLLQNNRLLGLAYLSIFDVANYLLLSLMFVALYAALRRINQGLMTAALALGLVGASISIAANAAFSMLSLSNQFAVATAEAERALLVAAGQSLLALSHFSTGGQVGLLLVAVASVTISILLLQGGVFGRTIPFFGALAGVLDIAYSLAVIFWPRVGIARLSVCFLPAAGLFWMLWHIAVGWKLCRSGWSRPGKLLASELVGTDGQLPGVSRSFSPHGDAGR